MILGINKYSHSTAICLLEESGQVLFALAKERLTRKKHDGGDIAELLQYALEHTQRRLQDIRYVVQNNHLFPIAPYEHKLPWYAALHVEPPKVLSKYNLIPHAQHWELSHHLAHAWSVFPIAPFAECLVVVMDGMGSPIHLVNNKHIPKLINEAALAKKDFVQIPKKLDPALGWREAESVYSYRKGKLSLVWKRWTQERSPTFLYNFGFEDMQSLGALYSRISSHIFGDWNVCGKVMGLAAYGKAKKIPALVQGSLANLLIDWQAVAALPYANAWQKPQAQRLYQDLAARIQMDLENLTLPWLQKLRRQTKHTNLCLAGGVALNSQLNGRIAAESGFANIFIPPYPGDDGVAFGCAHYAATVLRKKRLAQRPHSAYIGKEFSPAEINLALHEFAPWVDFTKPKDIIEKAAAALAKHKYLAWFQGRSEFGPRALGNRSILAHPGRKAAWSHINLKVKQREAFRPLAPTVLAERADEIFILQHPSPFMSFALPVRASWKKRIPAVVHVDGTARVQTLARADNPKYYALIAAFAKRSKIPLLLNTSFNLKKEPIVESPEEALQAFWQAQLDYLVLGDSWVSKKNFPARNQWHKVIPHVLPDLLLESREMAHGETQSMHISIRGKVFAIQHEHCLALHTIDGRKTLRQIAKKTNIRAIQELWFWRAIYMDYKK